MLVEKREDRARLRRKLELCPPERHCPVSVNAALQMLDYIDRLEEAKGMSAETLARIDSLEKEADWLAKFIVKKGWCPTLKAYKCVHMDDPAYPDSECAKCWHDAARKDLEERPNARKS